ncbi:MULTISPECIES: hypothetical protein [Prochlorococcus]|nr:hypothetical protein [Prochlorococcus marinus]
MHPGQGLRWSASTGLVEGMTWGNADGSGLNLDQEGKGAACRFCCRGFD